MDPTNQNPQPEGQVPGQQPVITPSTGSDWQRQAVAAAHGVQAATPETAPQPPAAQPGLTGTSWQQGLGNPAPDPVAPQQPVAPPVNNWAQPPVAGGVVTPGVVPAAPLDPMSAGMPASFPDMKPPKKRLPFPLLLGLAVLAVLILVASLFFLKPGSKSVDKANKESSQSASSTAIDIGTLTNVSFTPGDLSSLQKNESASNETFFTYSTADQTCAIGFGTVTAQTQPGETAAAVVDAQITSLRDGGATVVGPTVGEPLVLKDSKDGSKTYKIPTVIFKVSKDDTRAVTNYSIVLLKNGDRAVINRVCGRTDGQEVKDSDVQKFNQMAKQLTVTAT